MRPERRTTTSCARPTRPRRLAAPRATAISPSPRPMRRRSSQAPRPASPTSGATLAGTVNPNGATVTSTVFRYGTSCSPPAWTTGCSAVSASPSPGSGRSPVSVSATLERARRGGHLPLHALRYERLWHEVRPTDHTFVTNSPPTAILKENPASPGELQVSFDGSQSSRSGRLDRFVEIELRGHDLRDRLGRPRANIVHTYPSAGSYTASLTVTDDRRRDGDLDPDNSRRALDQHRRRRRRHRRPDGELRRHPLRGEHARRDRGLQDGRRNREGPRRLHDDAGDADDPGGAVRPELHGLPDQRADQGRHALREQRDLHGHPLEPDRRDDRRRHGDRNDRRQRRAAGRHDRQQCAPRGQCAARRSAATSRGTPAGA